MCQSRGTGGRSGGGSREDVCYAVRFQTAKAGHPDPLSSPSERRERDVAGRRPRGCPRGNTAPLAFAGGGDVARRSHSHRVRVGRRRDERLAQRLGASEREDHARGGGPAGRVHVVLGGGGSGGGRRAGRWIRRVRRWRGWQPRGDGGRRLAAFARRRSVTRWRRTTWTDIPRVAACLSQLDPSERR